MIPRDKKRQQDYILRSMIRQNESCLGGRDLDLIDTTDYRDIFGAIYPDSPDLDPSIYLPGRFR
jgi:hypothetical protein